jgi:hypothetical protein
MFKRTLLAAACLVTLITAPAARADAWNKKTTMTFSHAVELPGVVLPAGTYVFKLVDLQGTRNVVQVFNADEDRVFTTFIAIPHLHQESHDKTYVGFEERPVGSPMAVHEWFYPGSVSGLEFVYPRTRAQELAREARQPVLAADVKPSETPAELEKEPVIEITPDNKEVAVAEVFEPAAPLPHRSIAAAPAPEPLVEKLPNTASPLPLVVLGGIFSLALAAGLKAVRNN